MQAVHALAAGTGGEIVRAVAMDAQMPAMPTSRNNRGAVVRIRQAARAPSPATTPRAIRAIVRPSGMGSPTPSDAIVSALPSRLPKENQARASAVSVIENGLVVIRRRHSGFRLLCGLWSLPEQLNAA